MDSVVYLDGLVDPGSIGPLTAVLRVSSATTIGSVAIVPILADPTSDVNAAAPDGWTALHSAMANPGKTAATITQMLLDAGADVNATTNDGWTPLHAAAAYPGIHVVCADACALPYRAGSFGAVVARKDAIVRQ